MECSTRGGVVLARPRGVHHPGQEVNCLTVSREHLSLWLPPGVPHVIAVKAIDEMLEAHHYCRALRQPPALHGRLRYSLRGTGTCLQTEGGSSFLQRKVGVLVRSNDEVLRKGEEVLRREEEVLRRKEEEGGVGLETKEDRTDAESHLDSGVFSECPSSTSPFPLHSSSTSPFPLHSSSTSPFHHHSSSPFSLSTSSPLPSSNPLQNPSNAPFYPPAHLSSISAPPPSSDPHISPFQRGTSFRRRSSSSSSSCVLERLDLLSHKISCLGIEAPAGPTSLLPSSSRGSGGKEEKEEEEVKRQLLRSLSTYLAKHTGRDQT